MTSYYHINDIMIVIPGGKNKLGDTQGQTQVMTDLNKKTEKLTDKEKTNRHKCHM